MDFNAVMIFVKVVVSGSFTEAAKALDLPKSTVSDKVSELENSLGVRLLHRTTRKLALTEVGEEFFRTAEKSVNSLLDAKDVATLAQEQPRGTLKITAPADFVGSEVTAAVIEYRRKFPEVNVELLFTDRLVDLQSEGFDIGIRAGNFDDPNLVGKRLSSGRLILAASPKYLKKAPPLKTPKDLLRHSCLLFKVEGTKADFGVWNLVSDRGVRASVDVGNSGQGIRSNSHQANKNMAIDGQGVALLPIALIHRELQEKRLAIVLDDWGTEITPIYLIYPTHRYASAKIREMVPILEQHVKISCFTKLMDMDAQVQPRKT